MVNDRKLFLFLMFLIALPVALAFFGEDRFRYPCQDPANWDKDVCKMPVCDVTRTCPEHIFKGGRDPRQGPPAEQTQSKPINQKRGSTTGNLGTPNKRNQFMSDKSKSNSEKSVLVSRILPSASTKSTVPVTRIEPFFLNCSFGFSLIISLQLI